MALPDSINQSIQEAESSIRNALAFAARSEDAAICSSLAHVLNELASINTYGKLMEKLENGPWGLDQK